MNLKEYIKSLVRKQLEEDTGMLGGVGMQYATPKAFSGKNQKSNKATKESEKLGYKKCKCSNKNVYKESDYDKASPSSNPSPYDQASGYTGVGGDDHVSTYYDKRLKESKLGAKIEELIKRELLNEVTYKQFKNEVKYRTKNEMLHKSIKEVKRKLMEVDRLVEYTSRIKQELSEGEEGLSYWKRSLKAISEINELSNKIGNKIKDIYQ